VQGDDFLKVLYVTTIGTTMSFFAPFIKELLADGHVVDIATNDRVSAVPPCYAEWGCRIFSLPCTRSPVTMATLKTVKDIRRIVANETYDIVHCHTPVAAMCTRLACRKARKEGTQVFYTAHGFHFYKGAPLKNWLVYYPIEKICSYMTDVLITINHEDFDLANRKMKAKRIEYVPGVGVDLSQFMDNKADKSAKRREIGVPDDAFLLLSVGELNENKNHRVIIQALAELHNPNVHYAIAGVGNQKEPLLALANELGVSEQIHLLGYRKDISELNHASDVFCFPSQREGLGLAAIEAMACGLPVVAAKNRGTVEFVMRDENGFLCDFRDAEGFAKAISRIIADSDLRASLSLCAVNTVGKYHVENIIAIMKGIYGV